MTRICVYLLFAIWATTAIRAQESQIAADIRRETEHLKQNCSSFTTITGCGEVLFTGQPFHIAIGTIAPQNGVAAGLAFVSHWTPNESLRLSWEADAVASGNGSWRGGAYLTAVFTKRRHITVSTGGSGGVRRPAPRIGEYPVFHAYAQNTSLNKLGYFGIGPDTRDFNRSFFGMREAIVGGNVIWPVLRAINLSLYGEANGRFVDIRGSHGQSSPSIEQLYTEATAPGLSKQPAFAQFGEGIRARPTFANGYVRLNYFVLFQQYAAASSSFSFRRLTTDLGHQFPIYRNQRSYLPRDANGPNDCSADVSVHSCPSITRNFEGSFGLRFLLVESFTSSGNVVPFYFDPTIGGSDINGNPIMGSYQDYRFRAPNLMVFRGSFEHSIYGPLGAAFMIDEGKVALRRGDIDFSHFVHSYSIGLTLRAGGLPFVYLFFSWGGHEGTHTTAAVNNSLLGGSPRPPL